MSQATYPRISEKAYGSAGLLNVYTFVVPADANKHSIKEDVEKTYEVSVLKVNISILKGKHKRFMMRRGKQSLGNRQDTKKAYVTLIEGDSIPVFNEVDSDESANKAAAIAGKKGKNK